MKKFLLFIGLILFFFSYGQSQNSVSEENVQLAEDFFADENFKKSEDLYEAFVKTEPSNADFNFKLAFCYLQSDETVFSSIAYFEKAAELFKADDNMEEYYTAAFYKAKALHKSYQFQLAEEEYSELINITDNNRLKKEAEKELANVKTAAEFFSMANFFRLTKYGILNSEYDDHSPVTSADESVIMFTSRRPGNTGEALAENGEPYEDIYVYRKGKHKRPVNIGKPINTEFHDATCGLSVDGNELFIYRATRKDGGDIYHSKYNGDSWSVPVRLGENINTKYRETHASLSADGSLLYICSNRKGGYGGFDIYMSEKNEDGTWGEAKNLGPVINTKEDENGPYIHADGNTLYFSSEGHPGMGGFDIFTSEKTGENSWSEPENIGFPLNTVEHDVFFVPGGDGKSGYYSSQKGGSINIYKANFPAREEKSISLFSGTVKSMKLKMTSVNKKDCKTKKGKYISPGGSTYSEYYAYNKNKNAFLKYEEQGDRILFKDSINVVPQNSYVYLLDVETADTLKRFDVAGFDGKYMFILKKQQGFKMVFDAENFIYNTYDVHADDQIGYYKLVYNTQLDSLKSNRIKATRRVGFDNGITALNDYAKFEVKLLSKFLNKHPDLFVSVAGCDYLVADSNPDFKRLECEFAEYRKKKFIAALKAEGIEDRRISSDVFSVSHYGDTLSYTIYNKEEEATEKIIKKQREENFEVAQIEAELTTDEIAEKFGTVSTGKDIIIVDNMQFKINRFSLSGYNENLSKLALFLKNNPEAKIQLVGYTDLQGNKEYNYDLSEKRAEYIESELIKRGANPLSIVTSGKGFENPIAKNETPEGDFYWQALPYNRRVEIQLEKEGLSDELYVREVEVPKEYIVKDSVKNKEQIFAIGLTLTEEKLDLNSFEDIAGISEKQYSDGKFLYFFGKFRERDKVLDELHKVKHQYPEAFIFIR